MILFTELDDGRKHYQELGTEFHLIEADTSPEEFNRLIASHGGTKSGYAIIVYDDGKQHEILYNTRGNALLNHDGSLFKELNTVPILNKNVAEWDEGSKGYKPNNTE